MKKVIVSLLVVGLLSLGTCAITAKEQEGIDEIDIEEPTGPTPCGGGGGGGPGPGGVPG